MTIFDWLKEITYKKGDYIKLQDAEIPHYNVKTYKINIPRKNYRRKSN